MRPDWVMLGMPLPNGWVRLVASQTLSQVQLETYVNNVPNFYDPYGVVDVKWRYVLTAELSSFVLIDAVDYPTAFERLFKEWSPQGKHMAIDQGQKELE